MELLGSLPSRSKRQKVVVDLEQELAVQPQPQQQQQDVPKQQAPLARHAPEPAYDVDDLELPGDLELAVNVLVQEFQSGLAPEHKHLPPLVISTQLRAIVKDKRSLEKGLDDLQRKNQVRVFKLATGSDEHGILPTPLYCRIAREAAATAAQQAAIARQALQQHTEDPTEPKMVAPAVSPGQSREEVVAELFCERVIPHHVEVTISHSRLLALLAQQQQQPASAHQMNGNNHIAAAPLRPGDGSSKVMSAGNTKSTRRELTGEELVSTLLQLGLLARHLVDDSAYLFACPGAGAVIKSLLAGRKELLSLISRKPNKEVAEKVLLGLRTVEPSGGPAGPSSRGRGRGRGKRVPRESAQQLQNSGGFLPEVAGALKAVIDQGHDIQVPEAGGSNISMGGAASRGAGAGGVAAGVPPTFVAIGAGEMRLRHSVLGIRTHLGDLIGRGDLTRVQGPAGAMIRLVNQK